MLSAKFLSPNGKLLKVGYSIDNIVVLYIYWQHELVAIKVSNIASDEDFKREAELMMYEISFYSNDHAN